MSCVLAAQCPILTWITLGGVGYPNALDTQKKYSPWPKKTAQKYEWPTQWPARWGEKYARSQWVQEAAERQQETEKRRAYRRKAPAPQHAPQY